MHTAEKTINSLWGGGGGGRGVMRRRNGGRRFKMGGEDRQDTMGREVVKEITMMLTRRDKN